MAIPPRNENDAKTAPYTRTFFVTTKTSMGRRLLQSDRFAALFVDVLRSCMIARRFRVDDFVVMPDHVHLLVSVRGDVSIEKAMQFIKGGFSFRLKSRLDVWMRSFNESQIMSEEKFRSCLRYIEENPVRRGLVRSPSEYQFGSARCGALDPMPSHFAAIGGPG